MPNWLAISLAVAAIIWLVRHVPATGKCAACGKPTSKPECDDCAKLTESVW